MSRLEIEAVLADPERAETAPGFVAYHGIVTDRRFRVVVVADAEPPLVVTFVVRPK